MDNLFRLCFFLSCLSLCYNYLLKAGHDMLSNRNWDKENEKAKLHVNLTNDQSLFNASVAVGARGFTFFSVPESCLLCFWLWRPWVSLLRENLSCSCFSCSLQNKYGAGAMLLWWSGIKKKEHILITNTSFSSPSGLASLNCDHRSVPSVRHFFPFGEKRRLHRMRQKERGMPSPWFWDKIPGLRRCPEEGEATRSILAWRIPWLDESMESKNIGTIERLSLSLC